MTTTTKTAAELRAERAKLNNQIRAAEHPAGAPGGRQTNGRAEPGRAQLDPFVYMAPKDKCVGGFGVPTIHLSVPRGRWGGAAGAPTSERNRHE